MQVFCICVRFGWHLLVIVGSRRGDLGEFRGKSKIMSKRISDIFWIFVHFGSIQDPSRGHLGHFLLNFNNRWCDEGGARWGIQESSQMWCPAPCENSLKACWPPRLTRICGEGFSFKHPTPRPTEHVGGCAVRGRKPAPLSRRGSGGSAPHHGKQNHYRAINQAGRLLP